MKFKVMMKDPDTLYEAIREAVESDLANMSGLRGRERAVLADGRYEEVRELCSTWFKYGEYLTVEIDTEARTATVCGAEP